MHQETMVTTLVPHKNMVNFRKGIKTVRCNGRDFIPHDVSLYSDLTVVSKFFLHLVPTLIQHTWAANQSL